MSRHIIQKSRPDESIVNRDTEVGKVIITQYQEKLCSFLLKKNRLLAVNCLDASSKIGAIYIGKVKNVVKNIDACFVEIADKEICFLPFSEAKTPYCLNRTFDGRLVQGDEILVQVTKDALKTKQASVTCNITLQSEYFVFESGNTKVGISAKLSNHQKTEMKNFLTESIIIDENGQLLPESDDILPYGIIIRTDASKLLEESKEAFVEEFTIQRKAFKEVFTTACHRSCYNCIQACKTPYNSILDSYRENDYQEVITDLNEAYTSLQENSKPIRLYMDDSYPLKKLYSLETKLEEALSKTVWLKSGANLVIEQTECLNTIDVNSGKKIKGQLSNDCVWQINEEAAYEAALQIRLRNLSGIIIIDFINMDNKTLEDKLISLMRELLAKDPVISNVIDITPLGLMEITRKKVKKSLQEQFKG